MLFIGTTGVPNHSESRRTRSAFRTISPCFEAGDSRRAVRPGEAFCRPRETGAETLGVSRNTVLGAYELLCDEHLAIAIPGRGTRVTPSTASHARGLLRHLTPPRSRYSARPWILPPIALSAGKLPKLCFDLQFGYPIVRAKCFISWRRKQVAAAARVAPQYPLSAGLLHLHRHCRLCSTNARHRLRCQRRFCGRGYPTSDGSDCARVTGRGRFGGSQGPSLPVRASCLARARRPSHCRSGGHRRADQIETRSASAAPHCRNTGASAPFRHRHVIESSY